MSSDYRAMMNLAAAESPTDSEPIFEDRACTFGTSSSLHRAGIGATTVGTGGDCPPNF